MKRVLIASFLLGICIITLTAGGITQLADGRIRVGESEFAIIHWNGGWSPTVQDEKSVHFPGEAARDIGNGWLQRVGTFAVKGGTFTMTEKRRFNGSDSCEMRCTLTSPARIPTMLLALVIKLPIDAMVQSPPTVDGKKFAFGPVCDEKRTWIREPLGEGVFELETTAGTLRISGPGAVAAQDNRTYGQNIAEIRFFFTPATSSGLVHSELELTFKLFPTPQNGISKEVVISEGNDWVPLPEERNIAAGGITDFSHLLDAPAGKYGFCKRVGDHLEFEETPGKTARFWGANITGQIIFAENDVVDEMLDIFARSGMNLIRLHHFDEELYGSLFVKNIPMEEHERRFDYFIAACKKRGIYVTLDLQTSRAANASIIGEAHRALKSWEYRTLCYFDKRVRKHLMDFSRKMLTHKNFYTGIPLVDEPALIFIHLINESNMPDAADSPLIRKVAKTDFEQFCLDNGISQKASDSWRRFVRMSYAKGYAEMKNELRKMGVKIPLTDLNILWSPRVSELRRSLDMVDNHSYWGHPVFLTGNWSVPMSVSQASAIEALSGPFNILSVSRLLDRPMAVTEWDFVNPNQYNVEGPFLMAGYGALNDYSAFCRFQFASWIELWKKPVRHQDYFDFFHDPMVALSMRAGSCFFLRGDVSPAKEKIAFLQDNTRIDDDDFPTRYPDVMARIALLTKAGVVFSPDELPEGTSGVVTMGNDNRDCAVPSASSGDTSQTLEALVTSNVIPADCYDLQNYRFTSLTGELELVGSRKTFRVVTPYSEGFLADKDQDLAGNFAELNSPSTFTAVLAASTDGKPLHESKRILILHLTDSKGRNMRFQDRWLSVVSHRGDPGLLMRRGTARLKLHLDANAKIYACNMDGSRGEEVSCTTSDDGRIELQLDNFRDGKALCIYEITK